MSFTVIGDTVNTASRLQTLTRTLGTPLVVGDALVAAVKAWSPEHRRPSSWNTWRIRASMIARSDRAGSYLDAQAERVGKRFASPMMQTPVAPWAPVGHSEERPALFKWRQSFQSVRRQKLSLFSPRPAGWARRQGMESPAQGIQSQTQGNETPAQGNESQAQGNENRESCDFNRLRQILISGAPLTLTFCGSRSLKGASVRS